MTKRKKQAIYDHLAMYPDTDYITLAKIMHTTPEGVNRAINEKNKHESAQFKISHKVNLNECKKMLEEYKSSLIFFYDSFEWNLGVCHESRWTKKIPEEINKINNRLQMIEAMIIDKYTNT